MFKPIPEFPEYSISEDGEVYSSISKRRLSIRTNTTGYKYFSVDNGNKNILLSRALARVFLDLPSIYSELEVDHIDRDKSNNSLDNLQVLTKAEHIDKTVRDKGLTRHAVQSVCKVCGIPITQTAKFCRSHYILDISSNHIRIEDIEYWVKEYSWVRAGKELGMSDNGLRKYYKRITGKDPKQLKFKGS